MSPHNAEMSKRNNQAKDCSLASLCILKLLFFVSMFVLGVAELINPTAVAYTAMVFGFMFGIVIVAWLIAIFVIFCSCLCCCNVTELDEEQAKPLVDNRDLEAGIPKAIN